MSGPHGYHVAQYSTVILTVSSSSEAYLLTWELTQHGCDITGIACKMLSYGLFNSSWNTARNG